MPIPQTPQTRLSPVRGKLSWEMPERDAKWETCISSEKSENLS